MKELNPFLKSLLGWDLNPAQIQAFDWYEKELLVWNERFNLTAIRNPEGIRSKHFLDSITCALVMNGKRKGSLIDIGTGAGFPGIPLKILLPQIRLTLVESIGKKVDFCKHVINRLELEGTTVIQGRAEELGQDKSHREQYDWAVARAVANLNTLSEYLLPLVKVGGVMIAQKGEAGPAEAQMASNAFKLLGGHLKIIRKVELPGIADDRYLIAVDKVAVTPDIYPRRTGLPAKKPLQ
ncbi:MAG: 16S rRNA (guanine(527)-N(7))-methyltransferase RsmG [Chloroflexi bacterium]|nr:16S rRNA (guanine(527)-N(7))-methyltransferase RsmG [Chloroflexota bacterium]